MSQPPATSSSSSTSATPTDSAHRSCPSCRRRMSSSKFDKHSVCFWCRPIKCDVSNRCSECSSWSPSEIKDYVKHRRSLDSKSKRAKSGDTASPSVSPALVTYASDSHARSELDLKEIQSRVQADVTSLFANFIEQFRIPVREILVRMCMLLIHLCSDRILTFGIRSIRSPAKVGIGYL